MHLNLLSAQENKKGEKFYRRQRIKELKKQGLNDFYKNELIYDSRVRTSQIYAASKGIIS